MLFRSLVPYPHAADDHQRRNAEVLVRAGAAEMILERDLTAEGLADVLHRTLTATAVRSRMAAASRVLGRPDAAERIVAECETLARS